MSSVTDQSEEFLAVKGRTATLLPGFALVASDFIVHSNILDRRRARLDQIARRSAVDADARGGA